MELWINVINYLPSHKIFLVYCYANIISLHGPVCVHIISVQGLVYIHTHLSLMHIACLPV